MKLGWAGTGRGGNRADGVTPSPRAYRPGFSRVLVAMFVAFALWWVIDLAVHGRWADALVIGAWLVAVSAFLVGVLWRPVVLVDDEGVELRNVLRDVRVPWTALDGIDTRYALTLLAAGRRYSSWAGGAPGRPGRMSTLISGGAAGRPGHGAAHPGPHDHALPDPRWVGGGAAPLRSSRDLRADSGAAAFLVEHQWEAWRLAHPVGTRGSDAARKSAGDGDPRDGDPRDGDPRDGDPGDGSGEVAVRWRPLLPAVMVVAVLVALVSRPLLG